jgi:hypothetical protein
VYYTDIVFSLSFLPAPPRDREMGVQREEDFISSNIFHTRGALIVY